MNVHAIGVYSTKHFYLKNRLRAGENNLIHKAEPYKFYSDNSGLLPLNYFSPQIAFKGLSAPKILAFKITGIPCPCCGRKMLPRETFTKEFNESILSGKCGPALVLLAKYKEYMGQVELECFERMQEYSKQKKHVTKGALTLRKILIGLRQESLDKLLFLQGKVLDDIETLAKQIDDTQSKTKLTRIIRVERKIIESDKDDVLGEKALEEGRVIFKRKSCINTIRKWVSLLNEKDKEVGNQILIKALELVSSKDNVDAFIVKYSGLIKRRIEGKPVLMCRSSTEIGQRFVINSVATFEHINPKSNGGLATSENGLVECSGCNWRRRNTPFHLWVKSHPKMKKNIQLYMNAVIHVINSNLFQMGKNHFYYPARVAETLGIKSQGQLKIIIPKRMLLPEDKLLQTQPVHSPLQPATA